MVRNAETTNFNAEMAVVFHPIRFVIESKTAKQMLKMKIRFYAKVNLPHAGAGKLIVALRMVDV